MGLKNIFKKQKEERQQKPKKEKKAKEEPIEKEKVSFEESKPAKEKKEKPVPPKRRRKPTGQSYRILKSPHVTEKATDLTAVNQYVFKIWPKANKQEVRKAVEEVFRVDVTGVRIINIHPKKKRLGKTQGFTKGCKKAIVKLRTGQKIEMFPR